jgi:guanylate kinase
MSNEAEDWSRLPGRLIVVSGASGSGKSTLVSQLLERPELRVKVSISATTRAPREGEVADQHYYFVTPEKFEEIRGELLESAIVHGHSYGTPATPVRSALADGYCVILVIDVQGGFQVRQKVPNCLLIFIQAPSLEDLAARLRARGTDDDDVIERRLSAARRELEMSAEYDVHVINDELERAEEELASTLARNGCGQTKEQR